MERIEVLSLRAFKWRPLRPSDFFVEAVRETYSCELCELEINAYFDLLGPHSSSLLRYFEIC